MTGFTLGPKAEAAGYRLAAFETIGSTNTAALEAAKQGDPGKIWFTALKQTEGRGRRGRHWETPSGNLAASLLLRPKCPPEASATLGFVAGIALRRALDTALPLANTRVGMDDLDHDRGRIALKWPNDVLADGAKLAGILLESHRIAGQEPVIVVGIGVNIVSAPQGLPYPASFARQFAPEIDAAHIHRVLAEHWIDAYERWDHGDGVSDLLGEWREHAAGLGSEIAIKSGDQVRRGVFETIDDQGRLIVKARDGERSVITAGDVHFGATASMRNDWEEKA